MHPKILMILSAALIAALGVRMFFDPLGVLAMHDSPVDNATVLWLRMAGAAYLGFAMLNWAARNVFVSGNYARPIALGNFLHFTLVTIVLGKAAVGFAVVPLAISAGVFAVFAVWFGLVLFKP